MGINILTNYLSRSQVRDYLAYILENGTNDIVESPDYVHTTEPMPIRIGSSINSVKQFHVDKNEQNPVNLTQGGVVLSSNDDKPNIPADTEVVGIFYMSRYGKDYDGSSDSIDDVTHFGDIGDVTWIRASRWDDLRLGTASSGTNYRLFVFWKAV